MFGGETAEQQVAKNKLVDLLKKLDIKGADLMLTQLTIQHIQNMVAKTLGNFGRPDQLLMDPQSHAALSKFLRPDPKLGKKDN